MGPDLSNVIQNIEGESSNLTSRFVVNACIVISFFAILISFTSYYLVRNYNLNESAYITQQNLMDTVYVRLHEDSLAGSEVLLSRLGRRFTAATGAKSVVLFDNDKNMVWSTIDSGLADQKPIEKSLIDSLFFR